MHIKQKHQITATLILLAAVGVGIRVFGLGNWPITGDEYFSVTEAHNRWNSIANPLGYLLIVFSFETFGVSEWSARLPSFLLGVAAIPVIFKLGARDRGIAVAVIATALLVFHPLHIYQSQFSRFYTGLMLFGFLSCNFFFDALRRDDLKKYILSIASLCIAFLFHQLAILIFGCFATFCLLSLSNVFPRTAISRRLCLATVVIATVGGILSLPYFWKILVRWYYSGQAWGPGPMHLLLQIVDQFGLLICCAAFFGLIFIFRRDKVFACWQITLIVLPITILFAGSFFVPLRPDYIIYLLPFILLLAAEFADQIAKSERNGGVIRAAIPLLLVLSMLPNSVSYFASKLTFDGRDAVSYVQAHRETTDRIINFENTFKYYAPKNWVLEQYQGEPFSGIVDWKAKLSPYSTSTDRVWVILPKRRASWDPSLVSWLTCYARPVKEYVGQSFKYSMYGTSIYLKDDNGPFCDATASNP